MNNLLVILLKRLTLPQSWHQIRTKTHQLRQVIPWQAQITPCPEPVKPIFCRTVLKSTSRWKWGAAPLQFWRDWKRRHSSPQNILTTTPNGLFSEHNIAYSHLAVWNSCVDWMHFGVCLPLQQMTCLPLHSSPFLLDLNSYVDLRPLQLNIKGFFVFQEVY